MRAHEGLYRFMLMYAGECGLLLALAGLRGGELAGAGLWLFMRAYEGARRGMLVYVGLGWFMMLMRASNVLC